jgi:hypothetical protein
MWHNALFVKSEKFSPKKLAKKFGLKKHPKGRNSQNLVTLSTLFPFPIFLCKVVLSKNV